MWKDPIVEETRKRRELYASEHGHDIEAIFRDVLHRQQITERKLVEFPPRKPDQTFNAA
jgi:plasmid stability protein